MATSKFNKNKFKEVLHYIINNCGTKDNVGKTVLYKILYFADFDFYEEFEEHLTGESYVKLEHGPAPTHFDEVIKELKKDKSIKEIEGDFHGKTQIKYIAIEEPKHTKLNIKEITIVNKTIQKISNMNASQASAYSHQDMPWKAAEYDEKLDYEMVFYRDPITSISENQDDRV